MPEISVIVPIYNAEKNLSACLDSIAAQTYRDIELILVEDGSTDQSSAICERYAEADRRIRVIHKEHGGVSSARNIGLQFATGRYIAWVDADDWIDPDMYEYLLHYAWRDKPDIIMCGWHEHRGEKMIACGYGQNRQFVTEEALQLLVEDREIRNYLWDKLWRRELFDGVTFPLGRIYEDVAVVYRLFMRARKIVCLSEQKYHYRRSVKSITGDKSLSAEMDYYLALEERLHDLGETYPQLIPLMETQLLNTASKLWRIYYENPYTERVKYGEQLRRIAKNTKEYSSTVLQGKELGKLGRISVRLSKYPNKWAFFAAYLLNQLYRVKYKEK